MKKIILFASLCALALAGCTKEAVEDKQGTEGQGKSITILGTLDDSNATRVEIGDYTADDTTVPLLWNSGDVIVVGAYDENNTILQNTRKVGTISQKYNLFGEFAATTESPAATTDFRYAGYYGFEIPADIEARIFALFQNTAPMANPTFTKFEAIEDPVKRSQSYDILNNTAADLMFLTASSTCTSEDSSVELQFSNAFATLMLGLQGSAKIDSVVVKAAGQTLSYPEGAVTANVFARPEPGTKGPALLASQGGSFINDMKDDAPVAGSADVCLALSGTLTLMPTTQWIPVMVMPFTGAGTELTITVYGKPDAATTANETTEEPTAPAVTSVTRTLTIPAGTADITSNSIAYITVKEIKAEELGQAAPKTEWQAGETVLEDDFKWIAESWSDEYDKYGWTNPYNNAVYEKYNYYEATEALASRGYLCDGYNLNALNSYDGMLQIGSPDNGNGNLIIPMSQLYTYTGDVVVTFRAASYFSAYGTEAGEYESWDGLVAFKATKNGTTLKEVELGANNTDPFTWYEYTLLIENADAKTQLVFGGDVVNYDAPRHIFYIDDIKVSIANGETDNTVGTKQDAIPTALLFSSPEQTGDKATIEVPAVKELGSIEQSDLPQFSFAVSGPWELVIPEGTAQWLKVNPPQWSGWDDKRENKMIDVYGNQMTSICTMQVMEDNDTGAPRTATIQLKSGDTVLATYEITQPAADPIIEIAEVNFGPRPEMQDPNDSNSRFIDVTDQLTAEQWGIAEYALDYLSLVYDPEGKNPGMQISGSAVSKDYDAASGEGNLYFLEAMPAPADSGNDGDGDDPWAPWPMADNEVTNPEAVFAIDIPDDKIASASYLYINFGLWGRANYGKGNMVMDVVYSDGTTQSVTPWLDSAGTWAYFENRFAVPEGVTTATVRFYAQNVNNVYGDEDASSNFRIDDVNISVRSK